jgi:hypothetical protein
VDGLTWPERASQNGFEMHSLSKLEPESRHALDKFDSAVVRR